MVSLDCILNPEAEVVVAATLQVATQVEFELAADYRVLTQTDVRFLIEAESYQAGAVQIGKSAMPMIACFLSNSVERPQLRVIKHVFLFVHTSLCRGQGREEAVQKSIWSVWPLLPRDSVER